jgi:hypothetical protein
MSESADEHIPQTAPSAIREPPSPPKKIARGMGDQSPHEPSPAAPSHALQFIFYRPSRSGSIISGVAAWVFLVGVFLMSDPVWLHAVTFFGLVLFALSSPALYVWEKKHYPNATRVGLWLGCSALLTACLYVSFALFLLRLPHNVMVRNKLSVLFVGMTNNPIRTMGPPRVEVCGGAAGYCALFLVTNTSPKQCLWFKTGFVEQKTAGGWKRLALGTNAWSGIAGSLWTPAYGCLVAVGWPPGLPSNACWRLGMDYGAEPSGLARLVNARLGWDLFHSGKKENALYSSEVSQ